MTVFWVLLALAALWAILMGVWIWQDARRLALSGRETTRLVLFGIIDPLRYWYYERPSRLSEDEREAWIHSLAERLSLSDIRAARCPLCESEIPNAWTVDERGRLSTLPGPIQCPGCDFRLDACRHCRYFQPAGAQRTEPFSMGLSWTHGRCTHYKTVQPVEAITTRDMARRMRERGYTQLQAPTPIMDSYIPLEHCTVFQLDPKRLRHSGMRKPGRRQRLALRVLARTTAKADAHGEAPDQALSEEEQWLL